MRTSVLPARSARPGGLLALALAAGLAAPASATCDRLATFDALPVGQSWGAGFGTLPGAVIFVDAGIPFRALPNSIGDFGLIQVDPAFAAWGTGNILELSNINVGIDLIGAGIACTDQVVIDYLDFGGIEELEVNGAGLYRGDIAAAPFAIAPGVTCQVTVNPFPAGKFGQIILTGQVNRVQLGGQEFWIDDVCVDECGGGGGGGGGGAGDCDLLATYDPQPLGAAWGGPFGDAPGDLAFIDGGIPHFVVPNAAGAFDRMQIDAAFAGFGSGNVLEISNLNLFVELAAFDCVERVTFSFLDLGGTENLQVNGAAMFVGELSAAPFNIAPGVTCTVTTVPVGGGVAGTVELVGNVEKLEVGGQEFWIDDLCVELCDEPAECDHLATIDPIAVGSSWGAGFGTVPGDLAFTDDGVPFFVVPNAAGSFNLMQVDPAFPFFGSGNVLELDNINTVMNVASLGCVAKVTFDFADLGGTENLQVNGAGHHVGELSAAPFNIAPGVTCTVTTAPVGGGIVGTVELVGPITKIEVGGQELWIDDVCVELSACPFDLDCDGVVGFSDLLAITSSWGPCAGCPADVDGNGVVDFADLLGLLGAWGPC